MTDSELLTLPPDTLELMGEPETRPLEMADGNSASTNPPQIPTTLPPPPPEP